MKPDLEAQKINSHFDLSQPILPQKNHTVTVNSSHTRSKITIFRSFKEQTGRIYRQQWISEAAYFNAEKRLFLPGHELNDWLDAEQAYIKMLVDVFLTVCHEDGIMTVTGLQQLAKAIGVKKPGRVDSKLKLIRLIQTASRHRPCFRTKPGEFCEHQAGCQWSNECQKLVAEYWR